MQGSGFAKSGLFQSFPRAVSKPKEHYEGTAGPRSERGNQPARLPGLENFQRVLDNQADFIQIRLVIGRASGHLANTERHILQ